jgi:hypothetical protein
MLAKRGRSLALPRGAPAVGVVSLPLGIVAPVVVLVAGLGAGLTLLVPLTAALLVTAPLVLVLAPVLWACRLWPGWRWYLGSWTGWCPGLWSWLYRSWLHWPRLCAAWLCRGEHPVPLGRGRYNRLGKRSGTQV